MLVVEMILAIYFGYVTIYSLLFSISGIFYSLPLKNAVKNHKIAVFIPGYKEDAVIINTAVKALEQTYPKQYYDVIIIADSFSDQTLDELRKLDVFVHEVSFKKSTKVKSLNSALNTYTDYELVIILDADNIMENDFVAKMNSAFDMGYLAIQGRRVAKNLNTSYAILDGISEAINNHIARLGPYSLGLSSTIIGSAMAFEYALLKRCLQKIDAVGGFDKALQVEILQQGEKIHYLKSAKVYDEKVDSKEVFEKQRTRWIGSHYKYMSRFFKTGIKSINGNLSLFNITFLSQIQLPRILNIGLFTILFIINIFTNYLTFEWFWTAAFGAFVLSNFICIPRSYYTTKTLIAILRLPFTFLTVILIHLKLKGSDEKFIHTPHKH